MVSFFKSLKKAAWDAYTSEDFYTSKLPQSAKEPSKAPSPNSPTPSCRQRSKLNPAKLERSLVVNIPADISKQTTTRRERCASVFNAPVRLKLPRSSNSKAWSHAIPDAAKGPRRILTQVTPVRIPSKIYIDTASLASRVSRADSGVSIGASWERPSGKSWTWYSPESNSVCSVSSNAHWAEEDECPLYVVQQKALASQRGHVRSYSQGMVPAPRSKTAYAFPAARPTSYMENKNNHNDVAYGSSMSMRRTSRSGRTSIFVRRPSLPLALPCTAPGKCIRPVPAGNNHQQHFPCEHSRPHPTSQYPVVPTKRLSMAGARVPNGPHVANPTYYTHPSYVNLMADPALRV
ncbi:hypothetical protein DFS34DRAFT_591971 [Phlyctochytrium arcticum]|nr:hypothetical protein DFS34DRAFT_591971 [Phlyctochytrium arcticum]